MKYLQNGGFQQQPLMRLTLGLALLLLAGFWVTNVALYWSHMTLDPATVVAYYRGDEANFIPPRSAEGMLEVTHMHLPMFAVVLLLLTHLLIFAPMRFAQKVGFIIASFGSALLMEAAGWMTRFWSPGFALLKVAAFLVFQGMLAYLVLGIAVFLLRARPRQRRADSGAGHPSGARRSGKH
ncbi:MAG: hypothetical protein ABIU54_12860 [Candidatus Eisenbacteria bacterium]